MSVHDADNLRHIIITGKFAPVGFGQPGLNLCELPLLASDIVLNRLSGHIRAGAVELFRDLVKLAGGLI